MVAYNEETTTLMHCRSVWLPTEKKSQIESIVEVTKQYLHCPTLITKELVVISLIVVGILQCAGIQKNMHI